MIYLIEFAAGGNLKSGGGRGVSDARQASDDPLNPAPVEAGLRVAVLEVQACNIVR